MSVAAIAPFWREPQRTTVGMGEAPMPIADFFRDSPWHRPIRDYTPYQHPTIPAANSANWVRSLCTQMDLEPSTGIPIPGAVRSKAWMSSSNPLYIVPADQARRPMTLDPVGLGTVGGGDLDAVLRLGVPAPDDIVTENQWRLAGASPTSGTLRVAVYDGTELVGITGAVAYNTTPGLLDAELETVLATAGYGSGLVQVIGMSLATNASNGLVIRCVPPFPFRFEVRDSTMNVPVTAKPFGDRWVNIYQPATDSLWELFRVTASVPGGPLDTVGWGGVILNRVSTHNGTYQYFEDQWGRVVGGDRWGGNACSLANVPWVDMDVYADCVTRGVAYPTALPLSLGRAQGSPLQYVWPATRGDGIEYNRPDVIPEGARIAFPPGADFSNVRPEFMPMALAAQRYGIIPRDKTGSGCNLQLRNYSLVGSARNWKDVLTLYQTNVNAATDYMWSLPWHQAVIVSPDESR